MSLLRKFCSTGLTGQYCDSFAVDAPEVNKLLDMLDMLNSFAAQGR